MRRIAAIGRITSLLALMLWCASAWAQETETEPDAAKAPQSENEQAPVTDAAIQFDPTDNSEAIITRGQYLFEYGDYAGMVALLEAALGQERFDESDLLSVHRLLGIGHFILQNRPKAREHFLRLLTRDPEAHLDPLYVPPIIIEFFEQIREENSEMLAAILQQRQQAEEARLQTEAPPAQTVRLRYNPYFVNFLPFGAGQYQNDQPVKGTLFLTSEIVALGINIAAYFVSDSLKGPDGAYSPGSAKLAREWRVAQYVSLGVLAALMIGGTVDAALNYEEYTTIAVEPDEQPQTQPDVESQRQPDAPDQARDPDDADVDSTLME
jgi:tetratricopeptide (TPR) repeat protein